LGTIAGYRNHLSKLKVYLKWIFGVLSEIKKHVKRLFLITIPQRYRISAYFHKFPWCESLALNAYLSKFILEDISKSVIYTKYYTIEKEDIMKKIFALMLLLLLETALGQSKIEEAYRLFMFFPDMLPPNFRFVYRQCCISIFYSTA
jgi:hypothetical protein